MRTDLDDVGDLGDGHDANAVVLKKIVALSNEDIVAGHETVRLGIIRQREQRSTALLLRRLTAKGRARGLGHMATGDESPGLPAIPHLFQMSPSKIATVSETPAGETWSMYVGQSSVTSTGHSSAPRSRIKKRAPMFFGTPSSGSAVGSTRNEKLLVGKVANVLPGVPRRNVATERPLRLGAIYAHALYQGMSRW